MKIIFLLSLAAVYLGLIFACSPQPGYPPQFGNLPQPGYPAQLGNLPRFGNLPQLAYIKKYQMMHTGNPCVQCQEIVVHSKCSNQWHNSRYGCATPVVEYGLEPTGRCGQATIVCTADPTRRNPQSMMVVALLDNSNGQFGRNAQVYAPISELRTDASTVIEPCSMESQWFHESLDDFQLANPLQIQCASNVQGYILPPVEQRYSMRQQQRSMASAPRS